MQVLGFQLLVFLSILLSAYFGRKIRNGLATIITIFTIFAVFMAWLMILQLVTILVSFIVSESIVVDREARAQQRKQNIYQNNSSGGKVFLVFLVISGLIYSFYFNTKDSSDSLNSSEEKIKDSVADINSSGSTFYEVNNNYVADTLSENIDAYKDPSLYSIEDYGRKENEFLNGKWYYIDENREIESASINFEQINNEIFKFRLFVLNDYATGDISGNAKFISDKIAVFQSTDCESLVFDFRVAGKVTISEMNCSGYRGDNIRFDSAFQK